MAPINLERWKPVDDSSPGYRVIDPQKVVLIRRHDGDREGCPCGCGEIPRGKGVFSMGHDARFRGKLIRAHLAGAEIMTIRLPENERTTATALEVASQYGEHFTSSLIEATNRRQKLNREVLREALDNDKLLKVGVWEFTGQVAALYRTGDPNRHLLVYVTRMGNRSRKRLPAVQAREISSGGEPSA